MKPDYTYLKFRWLRSRGGRTFEDILIDDGGKEYVFMYDGKEKIDVGIYIPTQEALLEEFADK